VSIHDWARNALIFGGFALLGFALVMLGLWFAAGMLAAYIAALWFS
jgi:hypothetical protein